MFLAPVVRGAARNRSISVSKQLLSRGFSKNKVAQTSQGASSSIWKEMASTVS